MTKRWILGLGAAAFFLTLAGAWLYYGLMYVDEANLLTLGSDRISSFTLRASGGELVWRIEATQPVRLDSLRYGQVPAGMVQIAPDPTRSPRLLRRGQQVVLYTQTPTSVKEHVCQATGTSTVYCSAYEIGPLHQTN